MKPNIVGAWWGDFELPVEKVFLWQVGGLTVWIKRREKEWRIAYERNPKEDENTLEIMKLQEGVDMSELPNLNRFPFRNTGGRIRILPALADRSVVTRPLSPISIPPNEEAEVFVSTPLWFSLHSLETNGFTMEIPIVVPSDTWFGANTREGEICYSSQTKCRMYYENFPFFSHRAVTPLVIKNLSQDPLMIDRLNLPVRFFTLYSTTEGYLWTQKVTMKREDDEGSVSVKIGKEAPKYTGDAALINSPRMKSGKNIFTWALDNLLG